MAITYTGAGGVFTRLGKIFKAFLAFETMQGAGADELADLTDEILDAFGDDRDLCSGLFEEMQGVRDDLDGIKDLLIGYAEQVLTDPDLADELDAPSADLDTMLARFIDRMTADAETVDANGVSLGSVTADGDNEGTGAVIISLEDVPTSRDCEILVPETVTLICTDDAQGSTDEGAEVFEISGEVPAPSRASYLTRGTGYGDSLTVANASADNLIANGDFEGFATTNVPDGFDIDAGTAGTHIFESNDEWRGVKALKFTGTGAQATIGVSQTFASGAVEPLTKYALGVWIRTVDVTQGTITVKLAGTGYTPGAGEKIEIASDWPTTYTLYTFFVNTPAVIPDDFEIVVEVTGTLNSAADVVFNDLALVPAIAHHGLSLAAFAGASKFIRDDAFTCVVSNDAAGIFQTLFGRFWDVQLPSNDGGTETIDDSLCT